MTTVDLEQDLLTLIIGENRDVSSQKGNYKNGVGKSAILQAIHFALTGKSISNKIKLPNLLNKTNKKNLEVSLWFSVDGQDYLVERGRSPEYLKLYVGGKELTNDVLGTGRDTQAEIFKIIGMSLDMINQIVLNSTFVDPFMNMNSGKQRELIEELLGIRELSDKANVLKEMLKEIKTDIEKEEFKLKTISDANKTIQRQHDNHLQYLSSNFESWEKKNKQEIEESKELLDELTHIDIKEELRNQELLEEWKKKKKSNEQIERHRQSLVAAKNRLTQSIKQSETRLEDLIADYEEAREQICPTCKQKIKEGHDEVINDYESQLLELNQQIENDQDELKKVIDEIDSMHINEIEDRPVVVYNNIQEAYEHQNTVKSLKTKIKQLEGEVNPYKSAIENHGEPELKELDFSYKDDLTKLRDHQEFLYKMLTRPDSTIRKKIIEQNLAFLNKRMDYYLEKLELPHKVEFLNDMSVEITEIGNFYDFANLSTGQRARLSLAITWAFRDVWEVRNKRINLLFIDEILDAGMDPAGLESSIAVLKHMSRDQGKNVFIISHREELSPRVLNVMKVIKDGGFSNIEYQSNT